MHIHVPVHKYVYVHLLIYLPPPHPVLGPKLHTLVLDGTCITEHGLESLVHCPHLRKLSIQRCSGIRNKNTANQIAAPLIARMASLREVFVSNSRMSGYMLFEVGGR